MQTSKSLTTAKELITFDIMMNEILLPLVHDHFRGTQKKSGDEILKKYFSNANFADENAKFQKLENDFKRLIKENENDCDKNKLLEDGMVLFSFFKARLGHYRQQFDSSQPIGGFSFYMWAKSASLIYEKRSISELCHDILIRTERIKNISKSMDYKYG